MINELGKDITTSSAFQLSNYDFCIDFNQNTEEIDCKLKGIVNSFKHKIDGVTNTFIEEEYMQLKLTITESKCRCGYHQEGETYLVGDVCPPICHELWHMIYPNVYTLINGGSLDYGDIRAKKFDATCPDGGRVSVSGEVVE